MSPNHQSNGALVLANAQRLDAERFSDCSACPTGAHLVGKSCRLQACSSLL